MGDELKSIMEAEQREALIRWMFPESNAHMITNGVIDCLLEIEMEVARRYKNTEWFAIGFHNPDRGIVDRIIVPRQRNYGTWFTSNVDGDREGNEIFDAIKEAKDRFGIDYRLSTLFHSHHVMGFSFSDSDKSAFPGFLWYVNPSRTSEPIEVCTGASDPEIIIDGNRIIQVSKQDRKPIFEFEIDPDLIKKILGNGTPVDDAALASIAGALSRYTVKERFLVSDGYSVVFDRKGNFLSKQGFVAEAPISGGDYIHRMRDADLMVVGGALPIESSEIRNIVGERLNVPKPKKYSGKDRNYLKTAYGGEIKDTIIVERKERINYAMMAYEFAEQAVGYIRRAGWRRHSEYAGFFSKSLERLIKGTSQTLSDAVYREYLERAGFTKDGLNGKVVISSIHETQRPAIARKIIGSQVGYEKSFVGEFTFAPIHKKDRVLETYFGDVLRHKGGKNVQS